MLNISRLPLAAACFALVAATIVVAQTNSNSSTQSSAQPAAPTQSSGATGDALSTQPSATNPTNLPATDSGTTEQQSKAPVVDPQASGTNAAASPSSPGQAVSPPASNAQDSATPDWPAPQRYDAGRGARGNTPSGAGGASLGVNITGIDDGQGVVVLRVRPGTPADQMGLRPRDRILSLNGQPVGAVDEFISAIRGMTAGDQVQLSIDRGGSTRDIGGRLEAFREAIAVGEGPVGNIVGRAREIIGRDQSGRFGESYRPNNENMQTSYEDRSQSGVRNSGDVEARIARLEQQIERLTQEIHQLRSNGSSSQPEGANVQPGTNTPSAINATPEQPPRLQSPTK